MSTWQPKFKEAMLTALLGGGAVVKAQLIDTGAYTYSASHQFLSSVPSGARIGAAVTLTGKTFANGVFDATDSVVAGLSSAPTIEAIWIYVDTGDENTSLLAVWIDAGAGIPIAAGATGGTVTWPSDANKIAAI